MTDFLLKSTISMALLMAIYHFLLQKEKMHRFNRFYLLFGVFFSLALPFITIEIYTEVVAEPIPAQTALPFDLTPVSQAEKINYLPYVAWGIYGVIVLILALRFVLNILQFIKKIKQSETVKHEGAVLVLLNEPVLPHTFLHYIFLNKTEYESRCIEQELFTHEQVHVNQKHTLDILFIETIKTFFWFNPLLYFYKKAIQLNHEFLADEIVVSTSNNVVGYQQLLLQKAFPKTSYQLASSLNFSITKKRFAMMTKATTKSRAMMLKLVSLPVIAGLIVLLCTETIAQEKPNGKKTVAGIIENKQKDNERRDAYYSGVRVVADDQINGVKIDTPYEELTEEQKDRYMLYAPERYAVKHPTKKEFEKFKSKKGYALQIDGKDVDNAVLNKYKPEDFAYYAGYTMAREALTKEHPQIFHYQLYTPEYFEKHLKGSNEHYPDKVFTILITKEMKNDEVIADSGERKTFHDVDMAMSYLQEDKIYSAEEVSTRPEFPGGMAALYKFISNNFKVPDVGEPKTVKIYVYFVVEKNGSMSDIKILKDPGYGLGTEAERVLKLIAEKWKPGMIKNKPVRTSYSLPVTINISK